MPVLARAEPRQPDRPVRQRLVEVQESLDGAHDDLAEPRTHRAHPTRIVEREAVRLPDIRLAEPREQQPQVGPAVGGRADRRPCVAADPPLVDDDHRRQPVDVLDLRTFPLRQPVPRERRVGLVQLIPGLGRDRVEDQRRLPRPRSPDEDHQLIARYVEVDRGKVVRPGLAQGDDSIAHTGDATVRCGRILTAICAIMGSWPM